MKHAVTKLKVNPLDQVLYRNVLSAIFALIVALCAGHSFKVAEGMRWTLFARSCIGVAGNTSMTFGIALVPLVYQQTIGATTPFWAAICGFCIIGETIGCPTKVAMLISFFGVILIAISPYILTSEAETVEIGDEATQSTESESGGETISFGMANLIGCALILTNAACQGLVAAMTRIMQKIHWSVILFYYSLVALATITLTYIITTMSVDESLMRIFNYDGEQFLWIIITATFNLIALVGKTISNQNEKSGLITMFSYVGIVYACLGDIFIFHQKLNWLEWFGVGIIALTVISLTLYLLFIKAKKAEAPKPQETSEVKV